MAVAGDALGDHGSCANPYAFLEGDGLDDEVKGGFFVVVVAGHEDGTLGEAAVGADLDFALVFDPDGFADPGMVADLEVPWELDDDAVLEDDTFPNLGSEEAEDGFAEGIEGVEGIEEEKAAAYKPAGPFQLAGPLVEPRVVEAREVCGGFLASLHWVRS